MKLFILKYRFLVKNIYSKLKPYCYRVKMYEFKRIEPIMDDTIYFFI